MDTGTLDREILELASRAVEVQDELDKAHETIDALSARVAELEVELEEAREAVESATEIQDAILQTHWHMKELMSVDFSDIRSTIEDVNDYLKPFYKYK